MVKRLFKGTLLFVLFMGSISLFLPYCVERFLLPGLLESLPFAEKRVTLQQITPWKIHATLFLAMEKDKDVLDVPRFEIRTSLLNLIQRKISEIYIHSGTVHLEKNKGRVTLRNYPFTKKSPSHSKPNRHLKLPVSIERVRLKNCAVLLHEPGTLFKRFSFDGKMDIDVHNTQEGMELHEFKGHFSVHGALAAAVEIHGEASESGYTLSFLSDFHEVKQLTSFLSGDRGVNVSGGLKISGVLRTNGLHELDSYLLTCLSSDLKIEREGVLFGKMNDREPVLLSVTGNAGNVGVELTGFSLLTFPQMEVALIADYKPAQKEFEGKCTFSEISGEHITQISFSAKSEEKGYVMDYTARGNSLAPNDKVTLSSFSAKGRAALSNDGVDAEVNVRIPEITVQEPDITIKDVSLSLPVKMRKGQIVMSSPGELQITEFLAYNEKIASVKSDINSIEKSFYLDFHVATVLPEVSVFCRAVIDQSGRSAITCNLPESYIDTQKLPSSLKIPASLTGSGKVAAKMEGEYHWGKFTGRGTVDITESVIQFKDYSFTDVSLSLEFPDLPEIQSSPSQLCRIGKLDFGNIEMDKGNVFFRIDDSQSLFIEKVKLNWCGGRIETGALRLKKGMENLDTTLYCDRLGYTELLNQLGIGEAEGEGALNGRLPLFISRDGVRFDDGFLFSTPGNSGIVRFNNTDQLRQGMGAIEEAPYLEYSLKSLENFRYNWTKLRFNSEEKDLMVSMQLDGKPADPLPYGYRKGQIVKMEKGQGIQHPIRLDVNFRLPLNDIFRYGKNIKSLMENM